MQSIRNLEYQQCRICYDSTSNLQLLTSYAEYTPAVADKTYAQILLEVCNINVMNDKPLGRWPQFICLTCARKLILSYDFIQHTHKINKLLQSIADLLQVRSESDFIENPALDIPLEIKIEKDDDLDSSSNARKFQYSPVDVDVAKGASTLATNELCGNFPCTNNISKGNKTNNNNNENDNEHSKEILIPSTIEFISTDVNIKDDLEDFHRNIVNNMDNTNQSENTDLECLDDSLLCVPETETSMTTTDVVCDKCNKSFSSTWKLNRHKSNCHVPEDKKTYCTVCFQKFARPYNYRRHMKTVHKHKLFKQPQTTELPQKNKNVQQLNCTKKIKTKKLGDHACKICKKIFLNESRLVRHMRYTHCSEEQKITCHLCGHKSARPDNYQAHMRRRHNIANGVSHNMPPKDNQWPRYCCNRCGRNYTRQSLLDKHERDVHGF